MNIEKLKARAERLLTKVIKDCFKEGDERLTRLEARKLIREVCEELDDFPLRAETYKLLNDLTFEQLKDLYNKEEPEVDNNMTKDNETALFNTVVKGEDGATVTVYLNGDEDEEISCKKIKSFRFEECFYVLLQNLNDSKPNYYRYVFEKQEDGKSVEKLVRVNDEQQVSLFKFLGY